ncbi:Gustatory receptor 177 [Halyomorpha halys]|nr:Gustatory receptor 177 [Halyomorpha halys]
MTSNSLSSFLEPLYTLAKYSGLLPFDENLQLSERWWKISFLPMAIISGFAVGVYLGFFYLQDKHSYLSSFIEYINHTLCLAILLGHSISIYRFKSKLIKFGKTVAMLSEGFSYKLHVPNIYTPLGSLFLLIVYFMDSSWENNGFFFILYSLLFIMETLIYLLIMSFCTFLEMFCQHFKDIINDICSKSLELTTKKSLILISACEDICEIYGLPLLFLCLRCLGVIVIMGHAVSVNLHYFDDIPLDKSLKRLAHKLAVIFMVLFSLVMVTGSCRNIQISLSRFNVLVFREFRRKPNLLKNNAIKLYITKKPMVQFSACGFFSIENSLVTSILATAITYIVIFVQFNMPAPTSEY